jgi:hypothetical protein
MVASIAGRDGLGMTTMSSTATSPRPAVVAAGNVVAKAVLAALLAHAAVHPDLPQYADKAMGYRLLVYPLAALAVPSWWALRGRGRYPHAVDLCLTAPFLLDTAGNSANLYDSVGWWDDAMHVATWVPWVMAFGFVVAPRVPQRWVVAGLVVGFGAVTHIGWELGEYVTFVQDHPTEAMSAYRDTIGDLALSIVGSVLGALAVVAIGRSDDR